jgi:hypothetical protein
MILMRATTIKRNVSKRDLLLFLMGSSALIALARCGAQNAMLDAQILADAQGLESATAAIEAELSTVAPNVLTPQVKTNIAMWEAAIVAGLDTLTEATPAPVGATKLQTIDADLNQILTSIGSVLPAAAAMFPVLVPFIAMYDAALAILPGIEAYVNSVISPVSPAVALVVPHYIATDYSTNLASARYVLGIPTKN